LNELLVDEALSLSTCTSTPGAGETYIRFLRFDSVALSINRQAPLWVDLIGTPSGI